MGAEEAGYSGVVDVGVVLVSLFDNPLRDDALEFIGDVLSRKVLAAIPTSTFLGAYHVATRYLGCPRDLVVREIESTLGVASPAFVEDISLDVVREAVSAAMGYNIESWDGYLVALARGFKAPVIYSLDEGLGKVSDIRLVVPFVREKVVEYHVWIRGLLGR